MKGAWLGAYVTREKTRAKINDDDGAGLAWPGANRAYRTVHADNIKSHGVDWTRRGVGRKEGKLMKIGWEERPGCSRAVLMGRGA